ncbi:MAG: YkgJ family cysteine cluster protein [Pseudobdellovibrio sp.]
MSEKPKKDLFYEQGLRFECQGSGKCCTSHGEFGFVFLTQEDRERFAKHLKITVQTFQHQYCDQTNGIWHLKEDPKRPDCMFLKDKRCSAYEARPNQCRTWPFWPDVMNAKAWKSEVESFCPGVGKGRLWTKAEIEETIEKDRENELKLLSGG